MRSPGPLLTLLTLLVATATASGQAEPPATWQEAVTCLEDASSVDTEATGFAGSKSSTWRAYEVLRDGAAAQQLEALTKHGDPVVRTYAVWALAERHPGPALVQVLRAHLEDREPVTFFQGCIMQESQVSEVMLEGSIRHLAEPELLDLTARLLWLGSDLPILRRLLRSDPFGPQALPRLRELAAAGDGNALIVLSHHARPEDVPLLLRALQVQASDTTELRAALQAVTLFPDQAFRQRLTELAPGACAEANRGITEPAWYAAVAAWCDDAACTLLRQALGSASGEQQEAVGRVILAALGRQADCPAYDDLRWELLVEHDLTDHAALRRLEIMRPEATRRRVHEILRTRPLELPPDLRQVLQSLLDD